MAEPAVQELKSVRVIERFGLSGPALYEVHALWDHGPWRVRAFTSRLEADAYARGLLEGLNALDQTAVIYSWNHNETPE